jgi:hypothetical protein
MTIGLSPFSQIRERPWPYQTARTAAPTPTAGGINAATLAALKRAKAQYELGGGFGKGVEARLERGRVKAVAGGQQALVSAGLAGTSMMAAPGLRYEEEVAAPTRLGIEERRAQAVSGIEMAQAGMGFQAGQTGAQRSLQLYLAQLQADLQREEMAQRDRPAVSMTAPTGGRYAQQFPSIYGQDTTVPNWMGDTDTADTPWPTMAPFNRTMYGTQEAFEASLRR